MNKRQNWLKKNIINPKSYQSLKDCNLFVDKLYEKGYNCLDIIEVLEQSSNIITNKNKYKVLVYFDKIRKEYRNEKIIMFNILNFLFMRPKEELENILNL